jgi:hypothetical protein
VLVAIILAAVVILGGIVVVAMGLGGELARDSIAEPSYPDFESAADVARYRPPAALLGYHAGVTEQALLLIGRTIADRDAEIAWLRSRLRELMPEGERQDGALASLPGPDAAAVADQMSRPEVMLSAEPASGRESLQTMEHAVQPGHAVQPSRSARRQGDET